MRREPPLPAPFETLFAGLEEIKSSGSGSSFHECFGCGPDHDGEAYSLYVEPAGEGANEADGPFSAAC